MGGALRVGLDMAESQIISPDGHVIEPPDLWTTKDGSAVQGPSAARRLNTLTWGWDYPHLASTFSKTREILSRVFEGVPEDEQRT